MDREVKIEGKKRSIPAPADLSTLLNDETPRGVSVVYVGVAHCGSGLCVGGGASPCDCMCRGGVYAACCSGKHYCRQYCLIILRPVVLSRSGCL